MEWVGAAGFIAIGAFLGGLAVYTIMQKRMEQAQSVLSHKIEQLNATIKQLSRIANGRRIITQSIHKQA